MFILDSIQTGLCDKQRIGEKLREKKTEATCTKSLVPELLINPWMLKEV